jgi:hypothetical protein
MPFLLLVGALAWKMMRRASGRHKTRRSGQPANRERWFIMPVSLPNATRVSTLIMLECDA